MTRVGRCFLFVFAVLGIKHRPSHLLGKLSRSHSPGPSGCSVESQGVHEARLQWLRPSQVWNYADVAGCGLHFGFLVSVVCWEEWR